MPRSQEKETKQNGLVPAELLIPQGRRMRLIEWVRKPTQNSLQAETTVTEEWPLRRDRAVSSLICVELVAQAISALSTLRRGDGAGPRIGLLVGIKEAEFPNLYVPVKTRLFIQVEELYHVGNYAAFQGTVRSESDSFCRIVIQAMEPEEEVLSDLRILPKP